ncbi:LAGLIDADG endonuclease (mitochondrion) [Hirsutella rhossiliensis]|uniref:LAGLIDADG endonuclease n=2 Tax=Hirsutella rhossiliensis TaxID=111463 RepID=A0A9P8MPI0_9HYPO|nr:LAGLIDADG endonuclease [Hirsutella rhossiliensis]
MITSKADLKKFVFLINGKLRTLKIFMLYELMDWLNNNHYTNIKKLPLNENSLHNDAWLSGFMDLKGSFSMRHTETKKRKITCRLRIEIQKIDPDTYNINLKVLTSIAEFFGGKLLIRIQKSTGKEFYLIVLWKKESLDILVRYLDKYPLYSSKYLDYKDWKEIVLLLLKKKLYTKKNITKIDSAKNSMNSKRTLFNWDHLINLLP